MSKFVAVAVVAVLGLAGVGAWIALQDPPSIPDDADDTGAADGNGSRGSKDPAAQTNGAGAGRTPDRAQADPKPTVPDEEGPAIPEMSAEASPGAGLTIKFPECPELALLDWTRVGIQFRRGQRTLRKAAARVRQGDTEQVTVGGGVPDSYYQIMLTSLPLVGAVLPTQLDTNAPVASLLSFPPYQANAIASTLETWGRPLSEDQAKEVKALYSEYFKAWRSARARAPADTWPIEIVADLSMVRAAMQPKLEALLDERQRSALWPPSIKGRVGLDVFSPAMLWHGRLEILECPEGRSLAATWADEFASRMLLEPAEIEARRGIITEWFAALPKGFRQGLKGPLTRAALPQWDEIEAAVSGTPELVRSLREGWTRTDLPLQRTQVLLVPVAVTR